VRSVPGLVKFQPNWFLPKWAGGFGLRNWTNEPYDITKLQLVVAKNMLNDPFLSVKFSMGTSLPIGAQKALRDVSMVLKPNVVALPHKFVGPLRFYEDYDLVSAILMRKFLSLHSFLVGPPGSQEGRKPSLSPKLFRGGPLAADAIGDLFFKPRFMVKVHLSELLVESLSQ